MTRLPLALAVWIAWELSARVPTARQRDIARGLTALLVSCLVRALQPAHWVDVTAFVAWYGITAAMVVGALLRPRRGALALLVLPFAASTYLLGHESTYWLALAIQLGAAVRYAARGVIPGQVEMVGIMMAVSSLADVAGPWLCGDPYRDWDIGRWTSVVTWLAVVVWEWRCWTRARASGGWRSRSARS